jgi:hypothetical protein
MKADLDAFESTLLIELHAHVSERSMTEGRAEERPRHAARPWLVLVAAGAAAAVAAVVIVVVAPAKGSPPAYSIGEGNAGEISVQINRPEDVLGLEREMEKHGIAADITYLPMMQTCAPGRYTAVNRKLDRLGVEVGERSLSVTLPSGAVREGETFVLSWSVLAMTAADLSAAGATSGPGTEVGDGFGLAVDFNIATGPVAPCQPVAAASP